MPKIPFAALPFAALMILASPLAADPPPCTCRNLESLQQEYLNAVYLEGFLRKLAEHLRVAEAAQVKLTATDPTHPDAGRLVHQVSSEAERAFINANYRLPHPDVKDYTGPRQVNMKKGTCSHPKDKLDALETGSPCEAFADATLAHELAHRDLCNKMGVDAYWSRVPSETALEEADMYKTQAANLKAELRRVMDVSDLRLMGEFRYRIVGEDGEVSDKVTYDSGDLRLASQGGDRWTMTGTGDTVTVLEMISYKDRGTCTTGPVRRNFSVSLQTDGLTADVDLTGHMAIEASMTCSNGLSMPIFGGNFASLTSARLPVKVGDTPFPKENNWLLSAITGAASGGGASMTTDQTTTLQLTCEGQ